MAKALFVTYLIALSIGLATGYALECAVGPAYWCKSFENAQNCGAIQHCTDTVWSHDDKHELVASTTTCQWCQRIFQNTHKGFDVLADNENLMISTLSSECKSLLPNDLSTKCMNIIQNYGTSVISLIKKQRYATLCRLMNMCTSEPVTEKSPVNLGRNRCTWGPAYWCSSLSNTRECNSIEHCSKQIWSQQAIEKKENDSVCQYCEYIIKRLHTIINDNTTQINVENWLAEACLMLKKQEMIDECVKTMSYYAKEILVLINNNIDPGIICHLGQMCKDATIIKRINIDDEEIKPVSFNEQSKILCNVIVHATHDLYANQHKSPSDIQTFLKHDCQKLSTSELTKKCEDLVDRYGHNIYIYVSKNMELSKVCDKIDLFTDPTTSQSSPHAHCDLCTYVLSTTKYMLETKQSEDKVLHYIDEQLCSHWDGEMKKNCKYVIETYGKDFIDNIQHGTQPILLCTYFQVCLNEITDEKSPIQKVNSCNALIEKDTTRLFKTLVNDMEGDILCQMFGICVTKMSFIDNLSINDNKNKCKRCIDDFTRRKHIAEKLLHHSSEFLHHLCGQLPQEDECTKAVDDSINKLVQFIQSLNPQGICVELKICNETLLKEIEPLRITASDNIISQEVIVYIKNEICARLGPLSNLCNNVIDSEGASLFALIAKKIDPHKVCHVIDACPTTTAFENCNDKCECCVSKIENYQVQLATFLQTMLTTTNAICERIPDSESCREVAAEFKSTIDKTIDGFNAKRICQLLTHCPATPVECNMDSDKCQCCQNHLNFRQNNFRTVINELATFVGSSCNDNESHSSIHSAHQEVLNQINQINSLTFCQHFGLCLSKSSLRSIPFLSKLMTTFYLNFGSSIEKFSDNLCLNFGDLKPICEHLMGSTQSTHYINIYMALLKNDPKLIDDVLRKPKTDTCDKCKNATQSSKDFLLNELESVRNILLQTCEICSAKDRCQNLINQRFNNLKSYLNNINPEQFCQSIHLCSISLNNKCSTCIERLQLRKDGILQAIDRLTGYFRDLCQKHAETKQCQIYIQQIHDLIQISFEEFDPKETCNLIGFCTTDGTENKMNFDKYEKDLVDEIDKNICSTLGPFEILCKSVIHGDTKQIQKLKINYDIKDLMQIDDKLTENLSKTQDLDEFEHDKCKCCIFRIIRRKRHIKFLGDRIFISLIRSCKHCPTKHKCRHHWRMAKLRFDTRIKHINPKRVCKHLGFCNKSLLCNNMGGFQEICEETIQSEIKEIKPIDNSNSTCILCEYIMNILSNYINYQSTEEEIEENLQKICNLIPSILQEQCYDYIDNYGPSIITTLLQEFNLSTICRKLNLCTNQMKIDITYLTKANASTCGICDYISTYLHFALKRDSNEKSLQHALSTVCSHLIINIDYSKCQTIVLLFSPYIQKLELNPGQNFCKQLTICQTPMIELQPAISIKKEDKILENILLKQPHINKVLIKDKKKDSGIIENFNLTPKCTLCHYVISYLDAALKNNKSEEAIQQALEKVCTILPSKERTECDELITSYGPVLAELIAESADPDTACRYLKMCPDSISKTSTTTTTTMRYGKCIFGMKYWCATPENAKLCNAVELCERQVWSKKNILVN
ncbi:unnamed protein product [Rotaria sordida]|uniref:Proactivator polypeptide n=2 Tax=Rotaria sordida TaxID=392033 RepID=A0A814EDS8_9BILA|nr:unnamed protein product [Rotaria sordida]